MRDDESKHHVKIIVPLEQDEDGYPPVGVERLWARYVGDERYEIDNMPFFARGLALGMWYPPSPRRG